MSILETFLNGYVADPIIELQGYQLYRQDRTRASGKDRGGGLCIYSKKRLHTSVVEDWSKCTPHIEMQWLKLALKDKRDTYIANIYIPPDGNMQTALDTIEIVLVEILALGNKDIVLMGDFNADLKKQNSARVKLLKEFYQTNCLSQLIMEATRTTDRSSTLIDHVYMNRPEMYFQAGVYEAGIADHSLVYTARKKWKDEETTEYVWARSYRKYETNKYRQDIESADWSSVTEEELDVNRATINFYKIPLTIIDKHAPYKDIRCKGPLPTWFTNELMSLIDDRTYRLRKHKKSPMPENYRLRQEDITLVNQMKRELQRDHAKKHLKHARVTVSKRGRS